MTEPSETSRQAAQEPAQGHATLNGAVPLADPTAALQALEDRLQAIQVACALIAGLALLILVLEVKELRG